jgi:hypothetical protein
MMGPTASTDSPCRRNPHSGAPAGEMPRQVSPLRSCEPKAEVPPLSRHLRRPSRNAGLLRQQMASEAAGILMARSCLYVLGAAQQPDWSRSNSYGNHSQDHADCPDRSRGRSACWTASSCVCLHRLLGDVDDDLSGILATGCTAPACSCCGRFRPGPLSRLGRVGIDSSAVDVRQRTRGRH